MNSSLLSIIAFTFFPAAAITRAWATDVTVRAVVISLPNAEATQFSAQHDFTGKAGDALRALEELVAGDKAMGRENGFCARHASIPI